MEDKLHLDTILLNSFYATKYRSKNTE